MSSRPATRCSIDATPYNGVLEKARNAVRTAESPYDILNLDQSWNIEFYEQDVLARSTRSIRATRCRPRSSPAATATSGTPRSTSAPPDGGKLMAIPPNCNTHVLVYRSDVGEGRLPRDLRRGARPPARRAGQAEALRLRHPRRAQPGHPLRLPALPAQLRRRDRRRLPRTATTPSTVNSPEALAALEKFVDDPDDLRARTTSAPSARATSSS